MWNHLHIEHSLVKLMMVCALRGCKN